VGPTTGTVRSMVNDCRPTPYVRLSSLTLGQAGKPDVRHRPAARVPHSLVPPYHNRSREAFSIQILGLFLFASCLNSVSVADPPSQPDAAHGPSKYQGSGDCNRCHEKPTKDDIDNGTTKYFSMTELPTWAEKDKHALAYQVLKNSRSKRMGELLGIQPETDASCLGCHSVKVDASQCAEGKTGRVQEKGVSCEVCHGPASNWIDDHWHPNKWRNKLTRAEKTAQGLVDLRDDVTRAEVCLSCHVGNSQQGKVVTHDMFAAGHPPISGFEIETFARAMPKHWKPAADQPPEIRAQYADQRDPDKVEPMYSTRMMTIGGLLAMKAYARLVGDNAKARSPSLATPAADKAGPAGGHGTELAYYDCQACHHELTVDSWRQKRGYPGRPGRPAVRAWPIALGKIAAAACGEHRGPLLESLEKFYQAVGKQPFGAPDDLAAAADRLVARADEAVGFLKSQRFDEAKGLSILKQICAAGSAELPDFETARQLGWTAWIVYDDFMDNAPEKFRGKEIKEVLDAVKTELSLTIPTRAEEMAAVGPAETGECVCVANKSVPQTLEAAAKYDPRIFQDHCKRLAQLLAAPQK
jgi:hypothetical protein